jgi:hypothetical protein
MNCIRLMEGVGFLTRLLNIHLIHLRTPGGPSGGALADLEERLEAAETYW